MNLEKKIKKSFENFWDDEPIKVVILEEDSECEIAVKYFLNIDMFIDVLLQYMEDYEIVNLEGNCEIFIRGIKEFNANQVYTIRAYKLTWDNELGIE